MTSISLKQKMFWQMIEKLFRLTLTIGLIVGFQSLKPIFAQDNDVGIDPGFSSAAPPPPYDSSDYNDSPTSSSSNSSASPGGGKPADDDENVIRKPKETDAPAVKEFNRSEVQKACGKYQNKLISVYGEIYKIQNCKRHLIQDQEQLFKMVRQNHAIVEVDPKDVAAIPIGGTWEDVGAKDRPCGTMNHHYVTFSYTDIYFVENCVRHLIPDYETFLSHRKLHAGGDSDVIALTSKEFWKMKQGRDVSSVIDKEFAKLLDGSAGVDVIPIDEACKGVEGKIVTFYARMYKIEKCRKREIDPESFTMHKRAGDFKLKELKAEQWLSIPDGKALK